MVRIDEKRCNAIAWILRRIRIPSAAEEGDLAGLRVDQVPNFYFFNVAICHQTSPVGSPVLGGVLSSGEKLFGWDYLRGRIAEQVSANNKLLEIETWSSMTAVQLEEWLIDAKGESTLTGIERRAHLIRDLGARCAALSIKSIDELYYRCDGWLGGGSGQSLYAQLSQFEAYKDPVHKKSCFFLELMRNQL